MKLLAHYTPCIRPNYGSISRSPILVEDENEKDVVVPSKRYCTSRKFKNIEQKLTMYACTNTMQIQTGSHCRNRGRAYLSAIFCLWLI